jgi:hypothetical protein
MSLEKPLAMTLKRPLGVANGYMNPLFDLFRGLSPKGEALQAPQSPSSRS